MPNKNESAPEVTTVAAPERRQLNPDDLALLMGLRAKIESHEAAIHAIEETHAMVLNGMRSRYNVTEAEGWQISDYLIGFTREAQVGE